MTRFVKLTFKLDSTRFACDHARIVEIVECDGEVSSTVFLSNGDAYEVNESLDNIVAQCDACMAAQIAEDIGIKFGSPKKADDERCEIEQLMFAQFFSGLSVRTSNIIKSYFCRDREGRTRLDEFCKLTADDILDWHNAGSVVLEEIRSNLKKHGRALSPV